MNEYDIIIVGAGPAGSFAAELLSKGGVRVALFDGRRENEAKPCGGGVTSKALKAWPQLLNAVGRKISELDLYSPSDRRVHLRLQDPFAVYSRVVFDSFLRDRARDAGAEVINQKVSAQRIKHETAWVIPTESGGEFTGKMLVGAEGANSGVAKKLAGKLPPSDMEVAFGYRAPLPLNDVAPTVVAFLPGWVGYAWAFPRPDHISFGIATTQDTFKHQPLDDLLWQFMVGYYLKSQGHKAKFWSGLTSEAQQEMHRSLQATTEEYAARIPGLAAKSWDVRKTSGPGWVLLGDAAGFADPVTGEGIYYALRSAEIFAECYLEGRPETYEQRWREDFGAELRRAAEMRRRFYGNFWGAPFTERMIKFARAHPGVKRVLGELVAGDQGYVDLKQRLMKSAFKPF